MKRSAPICIFIACALTSIPGVATVPATSQTIRVSLGHEGQQAGGGDSHVYGGWGSTHADVSDDGRFVVFSSLSDNLVPYDGNGHWDVFLRDLALDTTVLLSATPSGSSGNEDSRWPSISADGSKIVFTSRASDLVHGDIDGENDIYLKDMTTGILSRISVRADGTEDPEESNGGTISGDGRSAAFWASPTLLRGSAWWFPVQVLVRDLVTGTMEIASVDNEGEEGDQSSWEPQLSHDGRFVAFTSWARNLGPVPPWPGCSSCYSSVYVRDRVSKKTMPVSLDGGAPREFDSWDPAISANGRFVAFTSGARYLSSNPIADPAVFLHDLVTGETTIESAGLLPEGINSPGLSSVSADGRYVAFQSYGLTLAPDANPVWSDIFVRDRLLGTVSIVSVDSAGRQAPMTHTDAAISADGRYVVWSSNSPTLVAGDTNGIYDVFIRRLRD